MRRIHAAIAAMAFIVFAIQAEGADRSTEGVTRDLGGRIFRSSAAKTTFRKAHPCPVTGRSRGACPGFVIDHIVPLKRGGADHPSNMQWQTVQQAKLKDRRE